MGISWVLVTKEGLALTREDGPLSSLWQEGMTLVVVSEEEGPLMCVLPGLVWLRGKLHPRLSEKPFFFWRRYLTAGSGGSSERTELHFGVEGIVEEVVDAAEEDL